MISCCPCQRENVTNVVFHSATYKPSVRPILEYGFSGLESVLSEAHQNYRVDTEARNSSHLRIRERISGKTWGPEMAFA